MANSGAIIDRQPNIILCHTAMETRIKKVVQKRGRRDRLQQPRGERGRRVHRPGDRDFASGHHRQSQMHTYYLIAANAIAKPLMWQRERMMPDRSSGGMSRILDGGYLRAESLLESRG